ncbi:hypothetical protein V2E39_22760 [Chryseobacterium arthrosphaerae]|uniref:Uncharacterized protein n=1 Tax=Chryseobacterium arthrosphaerae TaxID=651561 RepID=A0ABU7R613_9FLAO
MNINAEILTELLEDHGISIEESTAEEVAKEFDGHLSEYNSSSINQFISKEKLQENVELLKSKIKELENENRLYNESLKRKLGAVSVYVDGGEIKYDLR